MYFSFKISTPHLRIQIKIAQSCYNRENHLPIFLFQTPQKSYDEERKLLESNPFIKVLENSKLAVMLYEVYEKVRKTGVVRVRKFDVDISYIANS